MKTQRLALLIATILGLATLTSCDAIVGIFKAGMGFGIFLVLAVIVLIIVIFVKLTGRKNGNG